MQANYARALLAFHHILSSHKKRHIVKSARDIGIVGLCKVGHPGILVIEGKARNVDIYLKGIKALQWQSCKVLDYNENLTDEDCRLLRNPLQYAACLKGHVLMMDKMDSMITALRQAGLYEWWRAAMGFGGSK